MKFPIGSIVQVINDSEVYYFNAIGTVVSYNEIRDEYLVAFIATNEDTHEDFIYESYNYKSEFLNLYIY